MTESKALADKIAKILDEKGATDIQILEVGHMTSITDFFVVASGRNVQFVHTLADDLEDKLATIEDVLNLSAQVSAETNSKYISITKQPTSVSTVLGRGSDGLVLVFSVTASGSGIGTGSFNWQKKTGDSWINIDFDSSDNSRNATYGFQLEVSKDAEGNGYTSKIYATGLTEAAFGT